MQTYWFAALMSSICLEGLGRRYLPQIPGTAFYFFKDFILLAGFLMFRPPESALRISKWLYRGFTVFWVGSFIWTLIEVANPDHQSLLLAMIGLRAYWLWWIAPPLIAGVLQNPFHRRRAIFFLAFLSIGISVLAAVQFVSPPDADVNIYSVVDGEALYASAAGTVVTTGRARVSSTFSFITGFSDYTVLIPALLLSLGLETEDKRLRLASLVATGCIAAALPMSGSRSSVILGLGSLAIACWTAGLFSTPIGRRIALGGVVAVILGAFAFPDAFLGVQDRFSDFEETQSRLLAVAMVVPPVALAALDYPFAGVGTGMMQNAAVSMHIYTPWAAEFELHRYLVELGPIGFCLIWTTKLGLMVAFLRAYSILKRAGRRAAAGASLSYAAVTFFGNITFDHIWQALYFIAAGFILAETQSALETLKARERVKAEATGSVALAPAATALGG